MMESKSAPNDTPNDAKSTVAEDPLFTVLNSDAIVTPVIANNAITDAVIAVHNAIPNAADDPNADNNAIVPHKKKRKHRKPRHKKNQPQSIYSVLTVSKEVVTPEILEKEWVKVCRSRIYTYYIELAVLIQQIIATFETGMYCLEKNQLKSNPKRNARKEFAVSRACKYAIKMKLDLIRNDNPNDIQTKPINILALKRGPNEKESVIEQDPVGKKWVEYIIKVFEGTHLKCVKGPCLQLFEKKELVRDSPIICPECKTEQCVFCCAYWKPHDGLTCEKFSKMRYMDPLIIKDLKEGNMQLCPKCNCFAYREYGCNKMICSECKTYWCWACYEYDLHKRFANPYEHFVVDPLEFSGGIDRKQKKCIAGDVSAPAWRFVIERNQVGILARLREMGSTK